MKLFKLFIILFCLIELNGCKEENFDEMPVDMTDVYVINFTNNKPVYQYVVYNNTEHRKVMGWLNKTQTLSYNDITDWKDESDLSDKDSPIFNFSYKEVVKQTVVSKEGDRSERVEVYSVEFNGTTNIFKVKLISVDNNDVDVPAIEYKNCSVSLQTRFI